ncbi:MAG TPA: potassium/proton antiporter [Micromonosporaceae bacterium]|jgi:cell volume regulation protein A|nr:potassium/proton antiporter [Micromonosporaceae bacterium]
MTYAENLAILLGAAVILCGAIAVRLSTRIGLPSLLVYLGFGLALGESGLGIRFDNAELTRHLGLAALIVIIAEGGLSSRWSAVRPALGAATALATVGVVVSVAVLGGLVHFLFEIDWRLALLYAAVLSPTDAAAIFSTLRRLRLRPRTAATLEAESGMNDAIVVLIVLALAVPGAHFTWLEVPRALGELAGGALVGAAVGWAGAAMLKRVALPAAGLYPLAVVGLTVLAYAVGALAHLSGFIAIYLAGVVLGNARLPHRQSILGFADGLGWLAQIGLFVLLGLLASPPRLVHAVVPGLVVGAVLLFIARPISVAVSVTPLGIGLREQAFLSWAGLRGAIPIVLATIPLSEHLSGAEALFDVVFVVVVIFTIVQGTTLPPVAAFAGVTAAAQPTDLHVEIAPLDRMNADLLELDIPVGSRLNGVYLDELRLPVGAVVTMVTRDGQGFVPDRGTRLKVGDSLLIVATQDVRDATADRLAAVSKRGLLARWLPESSTSRLRRRRRGI